MMAWIAHIHPAPHMCSASFRSSAAPNQRPADVGGAKLRRRQAPQAATAAVMVQHVMMTSR